MKIGRQDDQLDNRPGFWLDGGTHASEWTGIMSTLYTISHWVEALASGDPDEVRYFERHTAYVMPCISPDAFQALMDGAPFIRSTLRPPADHSVRTGLAPQDLSGDGAIRWMRWKDPAGAYVTDPDRPMFMRPRTLDDAETDAYFVCQEGLFLNWDGQRWHQARREFGLDLNRNFPAHWAPFSMFGMDGGTYPLCEPESRAVVDTFTRFPFIGAAVTNHTYTGCILTQPYREDTPLPSADVKLMYRLAKDAVEGTGYRVFKTYPDFSYDKKKAIVGVWSDTLSTVFGVPGYTLELWDPFAFAGIDNDNPAAFFTDPDADSMAAIIDAFCKLPGTTTPWSAFSHPQLGAVEIGGLDYYRTVRNPPESLLAAECARGLTVAQRIRKAVPRVELSVRLTSESEALTRVEAQLDNYGFLSTSGLLHGENLPGTPTVRIQLTDMDGVELVSGTESQDGTHLDGWGSLSPGGAHSVYPHLSERGHRHVATWWLRGHGQITLDWVGGHGGCGQETLKI
jgi:hypothetical protein